MKKIGKSVLLFTLLLHAIQGACTGENQDPTEEVSVQNTTFSFRLVEFKLNLSSGDSLTFEGTTYPDQTYLLVFNSTMRMRWAKFMNQTIRLYYNGEFTFLAFLFPPVGTTNPGEVKTGNLTVNLASSVIYNEEHDLYPLTLSSQNKSSGLFNVTLPSIDSDVDHVMYETEDVPWSIDNQTIVDVFNATGNQMIVPRSAFESSESIKTYMYEANSSALAQYASYSQWKSYEFENAKIIETTVKCFCLSGFSRINGQCASPAQETSQKKQIKLTKTAIILIATVPTVTILSIGAFFVISYLTKAKAMSQTLNTPGGPEGDTMFTG